MPPMRTRCLALLILPASCLLLELPARAEPVPIDPLLVLEELSSAYAKEPIQELVQVAAMAPASSRRDTFRVRFAGESCFELKFGGILVWTEQTQAGLVLRAVHERDAQACFERAVDPRTVLEELSRELPPLPAPQLVLALRAGDAFGEPIPYARAVKWRSASLDTDATPARASLIGVGEGCSVEMICSLEPPRLISAAFEFENGGARIVIDVRPDPAPSAGNLGVPVEHRLRVGSIRELAPRMGDIAVGEPFPPMSLLRASDVLEDSAPSGEPASVEPAGPCLVVFFRQWDDDAIAAVRLAERIAPQIGSPAIHRVAVLNLGAMTAGLLDTLAALRERMGAHPFLFSVSDASTINRFATPDIGAVVVAVRDDGSVAAVARMDDRFHRRPDETDEQFRSRIDGLTDQAAREAIESFRADP